MMKSARGGEEEGNDSMGYSVIVVGLNASCETEVQATKTVEIFGRIMAGLALDGIMVSMSMQTVEIDETTPSVGAEDCEGPS